VYSAKIPDDGQRNCPKHAEFYSKNKFEKLVHLVDFIIRTEYPLYFTGWFRGKKKDTTNPIKKRVATVL